MPIFDIGGRKVLFMHVPKAGGSSVEKWLSQFGGMSFHTGQNTLNLPCVPQHFHGELIETLFAPGFFAYAFTIVRNPYWRLLSEYNYRMSHRRRRERILPPPSFGKWASTWLRRYSGNRYAYSNHLRPQVEFLVPNIEVFRLEDELPQLQRRICNVLDVVSKEELATVNVSRVAEERIGPDTARLIYEFYREDFEAFGYLQHSYESKADAIGAPRLHKHLPNHLHQNVQAI